ncbi:MAG: HTTM domain-containing protein [Myxococcota bacterium]|nr:HTTM domain-containing protein [Myxococcota bacterium]
MTTLSSSPNHQRSVRELFQTKIGAMLDGVTEEPQYLVQLALLRKCVGIACILNTLLLLPEYGHFFGPDVYYERGVFAPDRWQHWLVALSVHPFAHGLGYIFIVAQLAALDLMIAGIKLWLTVPFAFLATMNVWGLASVTMDGGNNLVQLVFTMLIFCNSSGRPSTFKSKNLQALSNAATRCIFRLIQLQIVFVYFCAGLYKFHGELWNNGMALYYTLQVPQYSHPWAEAFALSFPVIASLMTHSILLFQYLFPVLVFVDKTRLFMVIWGAFFHLGIMFVMGLSMFGIMMMSTYIAFLSVQECRWINDKIGGFFKRRMQTAQVDNV